MKKIIFDLDNTLLFLSDEWFNCVQDFINEHGLKTDPLSVFRTISSFEATTTNKIVNKSDLKDHLIRSLSIDIDDSLLVKLLDCYNNIPLVNTENIGKLLSNLSKKYELIAYTNWFTEDQIIRLRKSDLSKYFSKVYGWDVVPAKPSLEGLLTVINSENPADYLYVGDNMKSDLEIPSSIGMDTIYLNLKGIEQHKHKEITNICDLDSKLGLIYKK